MKRLPILEGIIIFLVMPFFIIAQDKSYQIKGLNEPVEIIIDEWGVPHIYANNEQDLFFAQGFNAAKDRIFQFEVWRRQATGSVAEILGPRELKRDIGTRLFMFRGDIDDEMNHYHPKGKMIITSFVKGVNAYIELTEKNPDLLPIEFELLGIKPQKWTPEVVISRHQGLLGNIGAELNIGRLVAKLGAEKVKELLWFHPNDPLIEMDEKINPDLLSEDILGLYNAYRRPVRFQPDDLAVEWRNDASEFSDLANQSVQKEIDDQLEQLYTIGSNNWVISGEHTQSGFPIMANDPHRTQAVPSLRYMAHLVAPGWNVIGGGEPEIPGISIGHNEHGAWGLTVYRTDAEDLYVYETNPSNSNEYKYKGKWEKMKSITEKIPVKGAKNHKVELKYTRHGPVVFENKEKNVAYAVRCGWMEIGGSPYLASLRMNQTQNFEEFREACNYSHIPGENMIWADREGNIGWQAVGIMPLRRKWSGLVPVPGDGSYEWDGYLPIIQKPNLYNPNSGIIATSNENVTYRDYEHLKEISHLWSDPYRGDRVMEVLGSGRKQTMLDMAKLQTDYLSIPARELVPLLMKVKVEDEYREIFGMLSEWDYVLDPNSVKASIYVAFENEVKEQMNAKMVPSEAKGMVSLQIKTVIDLLTFPDGMFGDSPIDGRDDFLRECFTKAIQNLKAKLGDDPSKWQYGQETHKHITLKHPMSMAVNNQMRERLEVGPAPRGGNAYTVNMTSSNMNQSSGASFRIISDTGDWDQTLACNNPGQSGDPDHPHYENLFKLWARDQFFPLFYSRKKIESVKDEVWKLSPK